MQYNSPARRAAVIGAFGLFAFAAVGVVGLQQTEASWSVASEAAGGIGSNADTGHERFGAVDGRESGGGHGAGAGNDDNSGITPPGHEGTNYNRKV